MSRKCIPDVMSEWNEETERIVGNLSRTLRKDREGKIREGLIELGWMPPGMAGTSTEDIARQVPFYYCTCRTDIPCPVHDKNYQIIREKLGMVGTERQTATETMIMEDHKRWRKKMEEQYDLYRRLNDEMNVQPDLPLKARVAQLVGWDEPDELTTEWAMGALEEYQKISNAKNPAHDAGITIEHKDRLGYGMWVVSIELPTTSNGAMGINESLPVAVCEAIVKHAETK